MIHELPSLRSVDPDLREQSTPASRPALPVYRVCKERRNVCRETQRGPGNPGLLSCGCFQLLLRGRHVSQPLSTEMGVEVQFYDKSNRCLFQPSIPVRWSKHLFTRRAPLLRRPEGTPHPSLDTWLLSLASTSVDNHSRCCAFTSWRAQGSMVGAGPAPLAATPRDPPGNLSSVCAARSLTGTEALVSTGKNTSTMTYTTNSVKLGVFPWQSSG